eukprot:11066080-Karenia_brevis.AAC.1
MRRHQVRAIRRSFISLETRCRIRHSFMESTKVSCFQKLLRSIHSIRASSTAPGRFQHISKSIWNG